MAKDYGDKVIFLLDAVSAIKPDANANISGEDVSTIVWNDGNPTNITNSQILTKYDELITAEDALDYTRKRKAEYPSIEELVVALYDENDRAAIDAKRATVKAKHPKPT